MGLFDLLYPKLCFGCGKLGTYLCPACQKMVKVYQTDFCPYCAKASISGFTHPKCAKAFSLDGLTCLFYYQDPLKKILHQMKYRFSARLVEVFENLLQERETPVSLECFDLVPVPLHALRENWRGFNQTVLLGEVLAKRFGWKVRDDLISRRLFSQSQVELKFTERQKNLAKAFKTEKSLEGRSLIVFDDVWTTGATLRQAGEELKKAGAKKVWGLTLATSHRVR